MIKGGYQILDFTGITELDGTETLPGAFNKIKTCGKPIMVQNLNGINTITNDANPSSTTSAVLVAWVLASGSLTTIGIEIGSDDSVTLLS